VAVAIEWLDPWYEVSDPAIREGLATQLANEIGKSTRFIACPWG
jgi:hypothetical protein